MGKKEILIIGSGVAGLSAGIYGQLNHFSTRIFEMHSIPGGQCTAWDRKGYRFDFCLHWLIGTRFSVYYDIWKETRVIDDTVEIVDSEIHSYIKDDKWGDFIVYANIDKWQDYLVRMAPEDKNGILKMCRQMKLGSRIEQFETAPDLRKLGDYMHALKKMGRLLFLLNRLSKLSAKKYFAKLNFKNPKLCYFLHRLYGETNYSALVIVMMLGWFHIKNAGYLVGGSLAIARRMAERYKSLGGELILKKKVRTILIEHDKACGIVLEDGTVHRADYVISAADGHSTLFDMLGGKYLTPRLEEAYSSWELYSPFVQVAFGINDKLQTPSVTTTCCRDPFNIGTIEVKHGYSILNLSYADPTLAPAGKTVILVRFDSAWENWEKLKDEDYEKVCVLILKKCTAILEEHFPGVTEKIDVTDLATPRTIVKYTGVWKGAYEGFLPTGNMMKKTLPSTLPNLKNFRLIGQWSFPGGGIPPAAQSGKWAIQSICHSLKQPFHSSET